MTINQSVQEAKNYYHLSPLFHRLIKKNPLYGRQRISQPMRIVGPIQFLRGYMIYLKEEEKRRRKQESKLPTDATQ